MGSLLPSGCVAGIADGKPDCTVAEVGNQVQPASERFDITRNHLEGRHFTMFDLRYPGDAHAKGGDSASPFGGEELNLAPTVY